MDDSILLMRRLAIRFGTKAKRSPTMKYSPCATIRSRS